MDFWDPGFINPLASKRPILLVDQSGIGLSGGEVPDTYAGWAQNMLDVVLSLGFKEIDVLGFSMGGFVAQMMALDAAASGVTVRKLIIAGSGPSAGEGVVGGDPKYLMELAQADTVEKQRVGMVKTFFSWSEKKEEVGAQWWERMSGARKDRSPMASEESTTRQIGAAQRWFGEDVKGSSYERLAEIQIPVLVANGSDDLLVPTENSWVLYKKLVNADAHLHIYPDSGHGFLDEYHQHFSGLVNDFLDGKANL